MPVIKVILMMDLSITVAQLGDFWAGRLYDNVIYVGVISFPHCPFDYCM